MVKSDNAVVPKAAASLPANYDYGAGNLGFEGTSGEDFSIPFLGVLQPMSPLVSTNDAARPGMIVNTVTGSLVKGADGVPFIPCATKHNYIEWKKERSGGSSFVAEFDLNDPKVLQGRAAVKFGKLPGNSPDTELVETFTVFGIALMEDGPVASAVSFSSTKIKKYKAWMTKAKAIQIDVGGGRRIPAPLPAHRYLLKTIKEKNKHGEFFNWDVSFDGANAKECRLGADDPLFIEAADLNRMVVDGLARGNHGAAGSTEGAPPSAPEADDEIPF